MPPDDDVRLRHLVDAAERAVQFTAHRTRSDLDADEMLTQGLRQALALVDVRVNDHFIVAGNACPLSFAERGLL